MPLVAYVLLRARVGNLPAELAMLQALAKEDEMLGEQGTKIDRVLNFNVPDALLVERVCGRLIHAPSGRSYHTKFAPPKVEGTDDITGEPLTKRKDDNAETIKARLSAFHAQTAPVIDHYRAKVADIKGDQAAEKVAKECEKHGLLVLRCGPGKQVVRFLPPLVVTREQVDEGVDIFAKAVEASS